MRAYAVLLLAALAAGGTGAEERYDLGRKTVARVNEVTTRTSASSGRMVMLWSSTGDSQPRIYRRYQSTQAVSVEKCLEVDAQGRPVRVVAHLKEWVERRGDEANALADTTLQGASVLVSGQGKSRRWAFQGDALPLSEGAREWLDAHFGAYPQVAQLVALMLPRRRVAVRESWTVDPGPLLEWITHVPVAGGSGRGTLLGVERNVAQLHFSFTLASRGAPFGPAGEIAPWKQGGTVRVTLEASIELDGARAVRLSQLRSSVDGELGGPLPEGTASVGMESSWADRESLAGGGELPPSLR